ncbi:DUF5789 family protein [Halorubrum vacuolatum]|nr:DUF5789 family protein [Halorubrum vacuolatum]
MSDTEEESEETEPAVALGDGPDVEGEPIARVASRLTWPVRNSDAVAQEGDATIRTPEGPRELASVLEESDVPLFQSRGEFVEAVEAVVGTGPVAVE